MHSNMLIALLLCTCGEALRISQHNRNTSPDGPDIFRPNKHGKPERVPRDTSDDEFFNRATDADNEFDIAFKYAKMMEDEWFYNWEHLENEGGHFKKISDFEDPSVCTVALLRESSKPSQTTNPDGCVLALSGFRNDADETIQGLKAFMAGTQDMCGYKMNSWSAENFLQIVKNPEFLKMNAYLSSPESKCKSVTLVGHSVGGAISTMLATCANHGYLGQILGAPSQFTVDKLYTYGAWCVNTEEQITNPLTANGCFPGMRFYTTNKEGKYDFMTTVGQTKGGVFAKIHAVGLGKEHDNEYMDDFACTSEEAKLAPQVDLTADVAWNMVWDGEAVLHDLHRMQAYVPAIKKQTTAYKR